MSILLGGNIWVGFEGDIHIEQSKLARNNAELDAEIVRIGKEPGKEIASPAEARDMLGIPPLNR